MRSFENGTLKMEGSQEKGMPPLNSMRVPMENAPAPHLLTQLNPERMYLLGDPRYLLWENVLSDGGKCCFLINIVKFLAIFRCLILSDLGRTKIQPSWWWGSFSTGGTTTRYRSKTITKHNHLVQMLRNHVFPYLLWWIQSPPTGQLKT